MKQRKRYPRSFAGRVVTLVASNVLMFACMPGDSGSSVGSSPTVALIDSLVLLENDSFFVGEASGFATLSDGTFLVSDKRNGTLHVVGSDGSRLQSIGRRGNGPEEWSNGPNVLVIAGDSSVIVGDAARLKVLQPHSGRWLWERPKAPGTIPVAFGNGRMFINRIDRSRKTSIEAVTGPSDSAVSGGPFTPLMEGSPIISQLFSFLDVVPLDGDTIAVAFENSNDLFVGPFPHGPFNRIPIPVVRRRGALEDLLAQIDERIPSTIERVAYQSSYPLELARVESTGNVALVSIDRSMISGRMTGSLFLSVVDPHTGRACVDAPVSVPSDPLPHVAFMADTLFVLSQDEDKQGKPRTIIRKFEVSDANCTGQ